MITEENEPDRAFHTRSPDEIARICMLIPVYYKIFRREIGINTYQASILFTLYCADVHNRGMFIRSITGINPMTLETVRRNAEFLIEKGYLNVATKKYYITILGMEACKRVIDRLNSYRGETIHAVELEGTYTDRMKAKREKAVKTLSTRPTLVRDALAIIEENKLKKGFDTGNVDTGI